MKIKSKLTLSFATVVFAAGFPMALSISCGAKSNQSTQVSSNSREQTGAKQTFYFTTASGETIKVDSKEELTKLQLDYRVQQENDVIDKLNEKWDELVAYMPVGKTASTTQVFELEVSMAESHPEVTYPAEYVEENNSFHWRMDDIWGKVGQDLDSCIYIWYKLPKMTEQQKWVSLINWRNLIKSMEYDLEYIKEEFVK